MNIFHPKEGALLIGMLIGDRSGFDGSLYQNFIGSGLVHIVAVSGGNIAMIAIFLTLVLFWVPLYIRKIIIGCMIMVYALVVGMDSSIFRAVLMALLIIIALLSGCQIRTRRIMGIASLLMLRYNPYFLMHDIGFIFSFAALAGIVLIRPWIMQNQRNTTGLSWRYRVPYLVMRSYLIPTMAANIAVMPFLLLSTGGRNPLSLIANLIVLPFVPLVMVGGFVIVCWGGPERAIRCIQKILSYIIGVSQWTVYNGHMITSTQRRFVYVLVFCVSIYGYYVRNRGRDISQE